MATPVTAADIGRLGGQARTAKKRKQSAKNLEKARKALAKQRRQAQKRA